jgi:hypothetical protein
MLFRSYFLNGYVIKSMSDEQRKFLNFWRINKMDGLVFKYGAWAELRYEVNINTGVEPPAAAEPEDPSCLVPCATPRRRGFWETKAKQRHGMFDHPSLPVPCLPIGQRRFRMDLKKFRQGS